MLFEHQGLAIHTDRLALDALSERLGVEPLEKPRVLLLAPNQFIPRTEDIVIIGPRAAQLPAWRDNNDIIVNLPNVRPTSPDMTASLAGALLLRKSEERQRVEGLAGLGVGAVGVAASFTGYVVAHNRPLELVGYGLVVAGGLLLGHSRRNAKVDVPTLEGVAPPIRLVRQA